MHSGTVWTLTVIAVAAVVTFALRSLPFTLLGGRRKIPAVIAYLGRILPAALMAVLIIYCLRDVPATLGGSGWKKLACVAVTAAVHVWRRNSFVSIAAGTAAYMVLLRL